MTSDPPTAPDDTAVVARHRAPVTTVAQALRGFAMGSADLVPGVSGGTIALVLGIYEHLVDTIRDGSRALGRLLRGDLSGAVAGLRAVDWAFLIPLVGGILTAVVVLAGPLGTLLDEQPVAMSALFSGLIVGSIIVTRPDVERWDAPRLGVFVATAAATFVVLGLRPAAFTDAGPAVMFGAGALAICAMILPGVSGSFILLTIGLYDYTLDQVHERDLAILVVFAAGAATGLGLFSTGLAWVLDRHRDLVLAALIGLLTGSLRVLWPWPAGEGVGETALGAPVAGDVAVALGLASVGVVAVLAIGRWGRVVTTDG